MTLCFYAGSVKGTDLETRLYVTQATHKKRRPYTKDLDRPHHWSCELASITVLCMRRD